MKSNQQAVCCVHAAAACSSEKRLKRPEEVGPVRGCDSPSLRQTILLRLSHTVRWLGSTVMTLDLRSRGRGFDSRSGRYQVVSTWMAMKHV